MNLEAYINLPGFYDVPVSARIKEVAPRVLATIYARSGSYPIKSPEIERLHKINGATVRKIVGWARSSGCPICSTSRGYWWANSKEELKKTIDHLQGRVNKIQYEIDMLKRIGFDQQTSLFF